MKLLNVKCLIKSLHFWRKHRDQYAVEKRQNNKLYKKAETV